MAKLNLYKFVNPGGIRDKNLESVTIAAKKYAIKKGGKSAGASGGSDLTNVVNAGNRKFLLATNRIGSALNTTLVALDELNETHKKLNENILGINKSVKQQTKDEQKHKKKLQDALKRQTTLQRGAASEASAENRGPKDKKNEKKKDGGVVGAVGKAAGGILGFLGGLVSKFVVPLVALGVMNWLSKPGNAEKAVQFMKFIGNIAKFFMKIIDFGVVQVLEGLATIFDSDANIFQKIIGFFRLAIGVFTLLGTWAILTGKVGILIKGLKLAVTTIKALPAAMGLAAKAAVMIRNFAAATGKWASKNPVKALAVGAVTAVGVSAAIGAMTPEEEELLANSEDSVLAGQDPPELPTQENKTEPNQKSQPEEKEKTGKPAKGSFFFSGGGLVPGTGFGDRVSAKLTPGEFVFSKPAVDAIGIGNLSSMNALGGGTNKPSFGGYSGGGLVRRKQEKPKEFAKGGIAKGPDSGYPAILHGTEAVIPLENRFTKAGGDIFEKIKGFFGFGEEEEKSIPSKQSVRGLIGTKSVTVGVVNPDQKWNPAMGDDSLRGLVATLVTGIRYQAELFAKVMGVKLKTDDPATDTPPGDPPSPPNAPPSGDDKDKKGKDGDGKTPAATSTPTDRTSLEKMNIEDLKKLLDPTKPGAQDPKVFEAARKARVKYRNKSVSEREKQVLIATILATQGIDAPPKSTSPETKPVEGTKPVEETKPPVLNQFANGGAFSNIVSGSGYINGPMSGYPVYMNGGATPSFIGHGLEYVTTKSSGGFVVPINTPATKSNGGLFSKRMKEAKSKGYNTDGMISKGFKWGKTEKSAGGTISLTSNGGTPLMNKRLLKGKTYTYADLRSHSHNERATTAHDGIQMGPGRDYGVGKLPNYMPAGPNGVIPTPQAGEVLRAGDVNNGYGLSVVVKGPLGPMGFHHLSRIGSGVKQGAKVTAGQIIGTQGATGGNYHEHLHLNATRKGHEAFVNFITTGKPTSGSSAASDASPTEGVEGQQYSADSGTAPPELTPEQALEAAIGKLVSATKEASAAFDGELGPTAAQIGPSSSSATVGKQILDKSKDLHKVYNTPSTVAPEVVNNSFNGAMPPIINTDSTPIPIPNYAGGVNPWKFEGHMSFTDGIGSTQELNKIK